MSLTTDRRVRLFNRDRRPDATVGHRQNPPTPALPLPTGRCRSTTPRASAHARAANLCRTMGGGGDLPDRDGWVGVQPRTVVGLHRHRTDRREHRPRAQGVRGAARLAAVRPRAGALRPQPRRSRHARRHRPSGSSSPPRIGGCSSAPCRRSGCRSTSRWLSHRGGRSSSAASTCRFLCCPTSSPACSGCTTEPSGQRSSAGSSRCLSPRSRCTCCCRPRRRGRRRVARRPMSLVARPTRRACFGVPRVFPTAGCWVRCT